MGRKLYVGNLPYSATEASLREAFGEQNRRDGEPDTIAIRARARAGLSRCRQTGSASGHAGDERCVNRRPSNQGERSETGLQAAAAARQRRRLRPTLLIRSRSMRYAAAGARRAHVVVPDSSRRRSDDG